MNLYAYAGNNPISYDDPFGLCPPADPSRTDDCQVILNGATISNPELMDKLHQFATNVVGHNVELNGPCSGDRTPACNKDVNGASNSPHLTREAADIHVNGMSDLQVAHAAANSKLFNGVEYAAGSKVTGHGRHTHVDIRKRKRPVTTWTERSDGVSVPGLPPLPKTEN